MKLGGNLRDLLVMLSSEQRAFVFANLPLAKYVATSFVRRPTEDDYHDAVVGLCFAVMRFDVFYGSEFSTFAVPTIKGTMHSRWRRAQLIRVPDTAHKSSREATREHARRARVWLVAKLDDTPIDHDWPDLDVADQIADLLRTLTERQQTVIRLRFMEEKNLREVGKVLKVTRERVRQIEIKAMLKLRTRAKERGIEYPCPAGSSRKKAIQLA
jgi:RNA polymerase sigma factor (sigma-70 family)